MKKSHFFPIALLALLLAQFFFVWAYLAKERTISFWDYAMYANMALQWFHMDSGRWEAFRASFAQDYNLLFAVPSLVSFSLFGATRFVFILTNFVCFFIPYELAVGLTIKRVFRLERSVAFLVGALALCAVPFAWYPLLEGYPDNGAAACFTLAVALALGDKRTVAKGVFFGILCAMAVAFRRHYAYPVLALLIAFDVSDFVAWVRLPAAERWARFWVLARFYLSAVAALVGSLFCIEPAYFQSMIETDYLSLYKSYEQTPSYFLNFLLSRLGLILSGFVPVGFFLSWRQAPQSRKPILFLGFLGFVWLAVWCLGPVQAGDHYLLAVPPLVCAVGLAGLVLVRQVWPPLLIAAGLLLATNSQAALWESAFGPSPDIEKSFGLFSAPRPPWIRKDIDQLKALASYIAQTTTDDDRIVVVGSSFTFNQDLMRAVYTDELHDIRTALRFLPAPEIDGKQEPPLNVYASANVYLVASPTQYHLRPEGQKVVTALAAMFPPPPALEPFFKNDNKTFFLDGGLPASVSVWRRAAWTPEALHTGLLSLRTYFPETGPWIVQNPGAGLNLQTNEPLLNAEARLSAGRKQNLIFLDKPLSSGSYRLGGTILQSGDCPAFSLTLRVTDGNGQALFSKQGRPVQNPGLYFVPFNLPPTVKGPAFLSFSLSAQPSGLCSVALWQLQLEEKTPRGLSNGGLKD